jgi:hypothetical protein
LELENLKIIKVVFESLRIVKVELKTEKSSNVRIIKFEIENVRIMEVENSSIIKIHIVPSALIQLIDLISICELDDFPGIPYHADNQFTLESCLHKIFPLKFETFSNN